MEKSKLDVIQSEFRLPILYQNKVNVLDENTIHELELFTSKNNENGIYQSFIPYSTKFEKKVVEMNKYYLTEKIYIENNKYYYNDKLVNNNNWHIFLSEIGWEKLPVNFIKILNKLSDVKLKNSPYGVLDCGDDGNCLYSCIAAAFNFDNHNSIELITNFMDNSLIVEMYPITGDFQTSVINGLKNIENYEYIKFWE